MAVLRGGDQTILLSSSACEDLLARVLLESRFKASQTSEESGGPEVPRHIAQCEKMNEKDAEVMAYTRR